MECKKMGDVLYLRVDKGEEVISSIMSACGKNHVLSATFQGIGACGEATTSTYLPEQDAFVDHEAVGMLEMVALNGNISVDDDEKIHQHCHALFSYLDDKDETHLLVGHLKRAVVSYTAEIAINPVDGVIGRKLDPQTGITVWDLS